MPKRHTVLITLPADQGDILRDFIEWHLDHGVDFILALDNDSTDGSRQILEQFARTGRLVWFPIPERDFSRFSPLNELARMARDQYRADWIIHCDVDEFLCSAGAELGASLDDAEARGVAMIVVPRHNITGTHSPNLRRAIEVFDLRVDRPYRPSAEEKLSGELPVPRVFAEVGQRLIMRASAFVEYGDGAHSGSISWGRQETSRDLYVLHYGIRDYETHLTKVRNTIEFFRLNPQLGPGWGWHWRRWIRLYEAGRLREDFDAQFPSPEQADQLLHDSVCSVDDSVIQWLAAKEQ